MQDVNHPIWATIRFTALVIAVTFVLYKNASSFDETEIKAILEIALMAGAYEGLQTFATRKPRES